MPKLKTKRGAAKRFKKTGSGLIKHMACARRHILTKKSPKRKRQLRGMRYVSVSDMDRVTQQLRAQF